MWNGKHILLILLLHVSVAFYIQPMDVKLDHDVDLLIFAQSWPYTVCKEWAENNASSICRFSRDPNTWTIHGVWPNKLDTFGPEFCNRSWNFDPEAVTPIKASLEEFWWDLDPNDGLWAYEWTKHGTCATVLPQFNSQLKYFSNGLNWMKEYRMTEILKNNQITPTNDKEYVLADIHKAVIDTLLVNPVIKCSKIDGKTYLAEIRLCFNQTMQLIDCHIINCMSKYKLKQIIGDTGIINIFTNCDLWDNILYQKL